MWVLRTPLVHLVVIPRHLFPIPYLSTHSSVTKQTSILNALNATGIISRIHIDNSLVPNMPHASGLHVCASWLVVYTNQSCNIMATWSGCKMYAHTMSVKPMIEEAYTGTKSKWFSKTWFPQCSQLRAFFKQNKRRKFIAILHHWYSFLTGCV